MIYNVFFDLVTVLSRQFARQKAAELEDFQGSTASLGEGVVGWYQYHFYLNGLP